MGWPYGPLFRQQPFYWCNVEVSAETAEGSLLLCSKLLNSCMPDTIDERALNLPPDTGSELPPKEALQNSNLCIHAATALGCNVSAISAQDILDGKVRPRCLVRRDGNVSSHCPKT